MSGIPPFPPIEPAPPAAPRTRPLTENPGLATRALELLLALRAFVRLNPDDARVVLNYMREVSFPGGAMVLRAGDHSGHMLLLLEGEVAVYAHPDDYPGADPVAVLGAGSVLGEMSLFDGTPRSATCVALSPVYAAGLARRGLELLLEQHPAVAAKLMATMAQQMAERLRATDDQVQIYAHINDELRDKLMRLGRPQG